MRNEILSIHKTNRTIDRNRHNGSDNHHVLSKEQKEQAKLLRKLPSDFPIIGWESLNTKQQLREMKSSGLNKQDQWSLLNAKAPLAVLDQYNQAEDEITRTVYAKKVASALVNQSKSVFNSSAQATSSKSTNYTPLQNNAQQRKLDMKQEEYETRFYEKQARHPDRVNTTNNTTKAPDGNETIADSRDAMEQKKDKVWDKSESTYNSLSATDEKFEQDEHPSDAGESTDDEGSKSKEDYFKKLKERAKKVVEKTPNSKNIQMFNLGNQTPYKLSEGEYYYVDESVVIGGIVIGRTVVFDEGKYAEYNYAGYSVGKSLSPIDHLWVKGYVNNIDKVKDFEGAFLNFAGGVGPFGSSASLGYNKEKQVYIVSASDVAQQLYAGAGLSVQYFSSKTPDWIQGEAPIRWGATTYDWIFNNYYPEEI